MSISGQLMRLFAFYTLSVVLFDIFVNILTHNLAEPAYEADVAQLEYKLVAGEHGLIIRVKGFNHKLPVSTNAPFSSLRAFKISYGCLLPLRTKHNGFVWSAVHRKKCLLMWVIMFSWLMTTF